MLSTPLPPFLLPDASGVGLRANPAFTFVGVHSDVRFGATLCLTLAGETLFLIVSATMTGINPFTSEDDARGWTPEPATAGWADRQRWEHRTFACGRDYWTWVREAFELGQRVGPAAVEPPVDPVIGVDRVEGARPLSSWLAVAKAINVDDSTIRSHRRRTGDKHGPFFGSETEAREWYSGVVSAPDYVEGKGKTRARKAKPRAPEVNGVVNWSKVKV